jgi:hypothetical protein
MPSKTSKYRTDSYPYKVYTAFVTQEGTDTEDSINSGLLTIGRTYRINEISGGMDFLNVGAPDNNLNTSFVATGQIPNSWGTGATYTLAYSAGAPVVKVLDNTIGDIYWTYVLEGTYRANFNGGFPLLMTFCPSVVVINEGGDGAKTVVLLPSDSEDYVEIKTFNANGLLKNTPLEIRVYQ